LLEVVVLLCMLCQLVAVVVVVHMVLHQGEQMLEGVLDSMYLCEWMVVVGRMVLQTESCNPMPTVFVDR
jgi:hypothetical protein